MASDDLLAAEAQWRAQFESMRAALVDLELPAPWQTDRNDPDDADLEGYSSANNGHDVWDFISDDETLGSSSESAEIHGTAIDGTAECKRLSWFLDRLADIAFKNGLSADVIQSQVTRLLASGRSDDQLQAEITDLVGFDDLDFIIDILSKKQDVLLAIQASEQRFDAVKGRLLSKSEREVALKRQDFEHKNALLAPASNREPQYPHVYTSYHAGNTLSFAGKKYALPAGSERRQFEKHEEYFIPARRKSLPGPGEKLVQIADLDALCRNTFKGYRTLNRMQSLVFPVGYKTNENMLICAPTGAVSGGWNLKTSCCPWLISDAGQNRCRDADHFAHNRPACTSKPCTESRGR